MCCTAFPAVICFIVLYLLLWVGFIAGVLCYCILLYCCLLLWFYCIVLYCNCCCGFVALYLMVEQVSASSFRIVCQKRQWKTQKEPLIDRSQMCMIHGFVIFFIPHYGIFALGALFACQLGQVSCALLILLGFKGTVRVL